jgi:5-oxoprolinase (ATP-hydrolysing)
VERQDGTVEHLSSQAEVLMNPGDVFVIETPGGGGFGSVLIEESNSMGERDES